MSFDDAKEVLKDFLGVCGCVIVLVVIGLAIMVVIVAPFALIEYLVRGNLDCFWHFCVTILKEAV